jgi:hypothetical protein
MVCATDLNKIVVTRINACNPRKFEFSANFVPLGLLPAPDEETRVPNQVSKCRDLKQTSDAKWSPLAVRVLGYSYEVLGYLVLALPTTKARIFILFRFIIEYSSLRDFGPS